MKKLLGIVLMVAGAAVMLGGAYVSLSAFSAMYQSNLADPLNQPEGAEKKTSENMLRGVYIGAPGIPVFIVGRVVLGSARRRARAAAIR